MKKGFTLIELLIVIGILAVLATVTVLVLNPAELFRQARDSQRISDLGSLKGAISLYLTTVPSPNLGALGFTCGTNFGSDKASMTNPFAASLTQTASTTTGVDASGWLPVNLSTINGGSPLSVLPRDPNRTDNNFYYAYACGTVGSSNELTFEINGHMESARYRHSPTPGPDDVENTDGGNQADRYETGTYAGLAL